LFIATKSFVTAIEAESESDSISFEAFFDKHFPGKTEQELTLAGYRYCEELPQQQLTELTGINRRHISEYGAWQASHWQGERQETRQGFTLRLSKPAIDIEILQEMVPALYEIVYGACPRRLSSFCETVKLDTHPSLHYSFLSAKTFGSA
jgi:hypothetical protein